MALPQEFVELYLELNSIENCKLNEAKIRALTNLFIHVACIQSWSSCFNASLLAASVLILSLKFYRKIRPDVPQTNYILWTCSYPVELVLGLAGYIAMIVADMPSEPTDRANHYFVKCSLILFSIEFSSRFVFLSVRNETLQRRMSS